MPSDRIDNYYAIDLKTGVTYGIRLDGDGNCLAAAPLTTVLRNKNGQDSVTFELRNISAPFGQTINVVEMNGTTYGKVFTMVWPSEADWNKGIRPAVTTKEMPKDLIKAGIAPPPKASGGVVDVDAALAAALKNIDKMIGLESAKRDIRQNIAVARFNEVKKELGLDANSISRHMVFTGNPGTGKTTFAREVAKVYKALGFIKKDTVYEVKREDLVAGYVGQTAIKTKEAIDKADGGVLFIDEAYALSRLSGAPGGSNDFGAEAIDTLVAEMENRRNSLIVIVAGYPEPMKKFIEANPGLKDRFMTYIDFQDYSVKELGEILDVMIKDRGYKLEPDAREFAMSLLEKEKARVKAKDFGNGRVVRNLVEKADKELAMRAQEMGYLSPGRGGLSKEDLEKALTTITLADVKKVSLDNITSTSPGSGTRITFGEAADKKPVPANDVGMTPDAMQALATAFSSHYAYLKKKSAKDPFKP